ncbi:MAG: bifunctional oligoribonuclease/PAP phosphatase NrnA [Treponema sp.]|jgi:phosphoesterase RecJ-like protein|nr:bifunctional oligoribonuclease/PAP phosphatase NrnA [Treponema sp.]
MARPVPVPRELLDFIRGGAKFLVAGHKEPDGDCVGSQLALCSALKRLGKEAIPCSSGPFKRSEVALYENRFLALPGEKEREGARVILMDCSDSSRAGDLAEYLKGLPLAIVDHHVAGQDPAEAAYALIYLDAEAPSVTYMTLDIIEALGLRPTREEAELLFFGLCTDTGFFRHVDSQGAETFDYAGRLIRAGANPKAAFHAINGGKSLASRKLLGIQLLRSEAYFGGKLILTSEKYEETRQFGLEGRDSDHLYQLLQAVSGVEAVAIIRQETPEKCSLGFRSRDKVDVAQVALKFGGGGHKNAAGANLSGTIEEIQPRVLAAFSEVFRTNL